MSERPVLSVDEAAELLGLNRNSVYEAAKRGELPTIRVGRRVLISRAGLQRLLDQGNAGKAA
jgi:excisionase family DNA binding protein